MRKISCHREVGALSVAFGDYREERQLKDLYKIYKKASGRLVIEYRREPGSVVAETEGATNSLRLRWDEGLGCRLRAESADALDLVQTAFRMLRYRYAGYEVYDPVFEALESSGKIEAEALGRAGVGGGEELGDELGELLALLGPER